MKHPKVQVDLVNIDHPQIKPLYDIYKRVLKSKHANKAHPFAQTIINVSRMLRFDEPILVNPIVKCVLDKNCESLGDSAYAINASIWLKIVTELAKKAAENKNG